MADVVPTDVTPEMAKAKAAPDWAKAYGIQAALVESNQELRVLFADAVAQGWTPANFTAQFQNTDWYKTHSDSWRVAFAAEKTDPASWNHEMDLARNTISNTAVATGISLDADTIDSLARTSLYLSAGSSSQIDPSLLKQHVVNAGIITMGGEALTTVNNLKIHGADMGVPHSDEYYAGAAKNILSGDGNLQDWKQKITNMAKTKYSSFADQLDAGLTVKQVASPYINSMANILEIPSGGIDLTDHTINKALTNLDATNKQTLQPIWQFETGLRKDPRWAKTKNARDATDATTRSILSDMGLSY